MNTIKKTVTYSTKLKEYNNPIDVLIIVEPGREMYDAVLPAAPHKGDYITFTRSREYAGFAGDTQRKVKKVVFYTWTPSVSVYV